MTLIRPEYEKTSHGHKSVDGMKFVSYRTGILEYAMISEDGRIMVSDNGYHRSTYSAYVVGHGRLRNDSGQPTRFRSADAAMRAAAKWVRCHE